MTTHTHTHTNESVNKSFTLWCVVLQMGANIKEFFSLVENFIDMIGRQMRDFQDIYEVTENLGECETGHECEKKEVCVSVCVFDCCFLTAFRAEHPEATPNHDL